VTGDHLAQTAACGMVPFLLSIDARMEFRNSSAKDELAGGPGWLEIGLCGLAFFWRPREPFEVVCNSTPWFACVPYRCGGSGTAASSGGSPQFEPNPSWQL